MTFSLSSLCGILALSEVLALTFCGGIWAIVCNLPCSGRPVLAVVHNLI